MNKALCDTCGESTADRAEGTELFCGSCYYAKLKREGHYDEDFWE